MPTAATTLPDPPAAAAALTLPHTPLHVRADDDSVDVARRFLIAHSAEGWWATWRAWKMKRTTSTRFQKPWKY